MPLSLKEAVALTGKSRQTLWRWKKDGVDITNEAALLEHSDFMDMRSVGQAAVLAFEREPVHAHGKRSNLPFNASDVAAALLTLLDSFKAKLASVADEDERHMLAEEVGYLTEAHRLSDKVAEGYLR